MIVETFEVTETMQDGSAECAQEQIDMIDELQLKGQLDLIGGSAENPTLSPYRQMTMEERMVYQTLCPRVVDVDDFSDHVMPLRVLQVVAHAKRIADTVGVLKVWCPESSQIKDPVLIGQIGRDWSSDRKYFLLARWGEVLKPFQELRRNAWRLLRARRIAAFEDVAAKAKAAAASLRGLNEETDADGEMKLSVPSLHD